MNWIFAACFVVVCVLIVHVMYARRRATAFKILQVGAEGVGADVLSKRSPVGIEAPCAMADVTERVRRAGFMRKAAGARAIAPGTYTVASEFTTLQSATDSVLHVIYPFVSFRPPNGGATRNKGVALIADTDAPYVDIMLYADNVLVLPRGWSFASDGTMQVASVDGVLTALGLA